MTPNHRRSYLSALVLVPLVITGAVQSSSPVLAKPSKLPDLKVAGVKAAVAEIKPGQKITVTTTVMNAGKVKAKPSQVRFYLSKDKARGSDLAIKATARVRSVAPRGKVSVKTKLVVPTSALDGSYYVLACADAAGKDARKANDCRPSAKATVRAPWKGTLTGTLTFDRRFEKDEGSFKETSAGHATVNVKINVDESKPGWAAFGNVGSTFAYTDSAHQVRTDSDCIYEKTRAAQGSGALVQSGDQYNDEILGDFNMVDHSEVGLLLIFPHQYTVTETSKPARNNGCVGSTTVDGPKPSRELVSMSFSQVSRTGKSVTYDVAEVRGPESAKTTWQTVTGKLTLTLR